MRFVYIEIRREMDFIFGSKSRANLVGTAL